MKHPLGGRRASVFHFRAKEVGTATSPTTCLPKRLNPLGCKALAESNEPDCGCLRNHERCEAMRFREACGGLGEIRSLTGASATSPEPNGEAGVRTLDCAGQEYRSVD